MTTMRYPSLKRFRGRTRANSLMLVWWSDCGKVTELHFKCSSLRSDSGCKAALLDQCVSVCEIYALVYVISSKVIVAGPGRAVRWLRGAMCCSYASTNEEQR